MRNRIGLCLIGLVSCLILAAVWAVLAVPGTTLANPPDADRNHSHGGDDVGGTTGILFDVLLGVDDLGIPLGNPDIFMVCGAGIEGWIGGAGGANVDRLIVDDPRPFMDITSVINALDDKSCFADLLEDGRYVVRRHAMLHIALPDRNFDVMTVGFSVEANNTKGRIVGYRINTIGRLVSDLDGDGENEFGTKEDWAAVQDAVYDGTADPVVIPNFFVQVDPEAEWTLFKSDGSQKFACTGSGAFVNGFGISIGRPRSVPDLSQLPPCP